MRPRTIATPLVTASLLFAPVAAAWAGEYTVEQGDTLSHIADRHGTSWPEIFELNRDAIADPDLIFPGQVIAVEGDPKASAPKPRSGPADAAQSGTVRPATGSITSSYGMRTHPITGVYKLHTGTDFAVGDGNAYAAKAGTVASVSWVNWAGNLVTVDHGSGVTTRYAHLASTSVAAGQKVSAGDVVGRIGATGYATGPHLHFEVIRNGEFVDPMAWLD